MEDGKMPPGNSKILGPVLQVLANELKSLDSFPLKLVGCTQNKPVILFLTLLPEMLLYVWFKLVYMFTHKWLKPIAICIR